MCHEILFFLFFSQSFENVQIILAHRLYLKQEGLDLAPRL